MFFSFYYVLNVCSQRTYQRLLCYNLNCFMIFFIRGKLSFRLSSNKICSQEQDIVMGFETPAVKNLCSSKSPSLVGNSQTLINAVTGNLFYAYRSHPILSSSRFALFLGIGRRLRIGQKRRISGFTPGCWYDP